MIMIEIIKKKKLKTNIYYVNVNLSGDMLKCHENVDAMQKKVMVLNKT